MAEIAGNVTFKFDTLIANLNSFAKTVEDKLNTMKGDGKSEISIGDMFHMQMLMNKLSQFSEMSTGIVSASNTAIASMARNVKA